MKKVLAILLSVLLLMACVPLGALPVLAATSGTIGDCTWALDDNGLLTISGEGMMGDCSSNSRPWGNGITSVTIEEGVTKIGSYAFANCPVLKSVTLSDTITNIGWAAFENCTALTAIVIPDSVTYIDSYAFQNCAALKDVTLSKNLTTMGYYAFTGTAIEEILIPASLDSCGAVWEEGPFFNSALKIAYFETGTTQVAEYLFAGCTTLETVTIPDTVTTIEYYAFFECVNLTNVTLPDALTTIGWGSFEGCTALTAIVIPDSVTYIDSYAFQNCAALKDVTLSKNLTTMGYYAFTGTAIEEILIPKSLDSCGTVWEEGPFANCTLKTTYFETGTTQVAENLFAGCTALETVTIPDTVTTIESSAFRGCTALQNVTFSNALIEIRDNAFTRCSALTEIALPKVLTTIGWGAFEDCSALTTIVIPDAVATIESYAFQNCTTLSSVTLPKRLEHLGYYAFTGTAVEEITIPKSLESCNAVWNDGPFADSALKTAYFETGITKIPPHLFSGCGTLETVIIPDTVTVIEQNVFYECSALQNVTLPAGLTTIGWGAFEYCALTEIVIPDSVTTIERYAFNNCTSLESVTLPSALTYINNYMFQECTSLKTIDIPATVTEITTNAFNGCTALESVTFSDGSALKTIGDSAFYGCSALKEMVLPETVTSIGYDAFRNCTALEKVVIPQSTKTIGSGAFMGCQSLTDVTIADYSIIRLENYVFKDCPALVTITLPKGLTYIGSEAFKNNTSLMGVVIPESVTTIQTNAFSYPEWMVIYGKPGSYAETFANENGFRFESNYVPAEGLSLVDGVEYIVLDRGETYRAQFEFYPEEANDVVVLTSSNNKVTISGMNIYGSSTGDTVITATTSGGITYEFIVHVRDAKSIAVSATPNKTQYVLGEELDTTGLTVQVNYDDGTYETVTDYTISGFDSSVEGECTIKVEWKSARNSTYSTTFTVTIVDPSAKLTGIYVHTLPNKVTYLRKESLDLTGLVVMGTYTDGSEQEMTDYAVSGYNALKVGEQTLTVTCGEFTATFTVTVENAHTHTYDNDCDADCNGCGALREVGDHVYDNDTDADCNVCGAVREIVTSTPGDVNGDGRINNRDLGLLQQHLAGWDVTVDLDACDVNGDGRVNNRDLGLFQQHLAGWDVELK